MESKTLKPSLRFKGFSDTWEQPELDFLANKFDNLRVPVSAVDRVRGNTPYYGANGVQGYVEGCTHKGEFILVAEDGANDLKNYPVQYVNGEVWVNNHAHVLQGKVNFADTKFLGYAISQTNIEPFLVGGGRAKLNASTMMKIMILIPKNTQEQQRIGLLFENLESLINLQQRKYEKLVNVKKALLDKMFPKKGEAVPKLRFKGFTDTWEQSVLGEIVPITMGQSPNGVNYTSNPEDYILVQGNADMENGKVVPRVWTTQITKLAKKNDLIFSVRAPVGSVGKTDYEAVIGRGVASIRGNEFIYQQLIKLNQSGFWKRISTGSTFDSINSTELKNISVKAPDKIEQEKIGSFLKSIDSLIFLQQREYEKLGNIKKALLQKMFI